MKIFTLFTLILMTFTMMSCGKKNDSGGGSATGVFTNQLSTQDGYYDLQTQYLEFNGASYPPNQAFASAINQAIYQARMSNVQPQIINGSQKYRARVTAYNPNYGSQYPTNTTYPNQYNPYNPYGTSGATLGGQTGQYGQTIVLQSVVFY